MRIWVRACDSFSDPDDSYNMVEIYHNKIDCRHKNIGTRAFICRKYISKLATEAGKKLPEHGSDEVVTFCVRGCRK